MKGLKVQCPGCKKVFHETTEKYDPDVRPNGAMVRLLEPWKGWGWAAFDAEGAAVSTTLCSEMLCPGCTAPLAPSGRLTVIIPEARIEFLEIPNREVPAPLQEDAKLNDQVDTEVTYVGEPPIPGSDSPEESKGKTIEEPQPPTPKQKKKKKANALKKKAKKRK